MSNNCLEKIFNPVKFNKSILIVSIATEQTKSGSVLVYKYRSPSPYQFSKCNFYNIQKLAYVGSVLRQFLGRALRLGHRLGGRALLRLGQAKGPGHMKNNINVIHLRFMYKIG